MTSISTIKKLLSFAFFIIFPSITQATVIWEQPLDANQWANSPVKSYCSPCNGNEQRIFGSFHVSNLSKLRSLEFYSDGSSPHFSITIWEVFFRGPMYSAEYLTGQYISQSVFPNDPSLNGLSKISLNIPNWGVDPVDYYISIYGLNGTNFFWGTDQRISDDVTSLDSLDPINHITDDDVYVGFKLSDEQIQLIPEPNSLSLTLFGLVGGLLLMNRKIVYNTRPFRMSTHIRYSETKIKSKI